MNTVALLLLVLNGLTTQALAWDLGSLLQNVGASVRDQSYCRMVECCNDQQIPADMRVLQNTMEANLFGQHIVLQRLVPALAAHFNAGNKARKHLVLSFQGSHGTGKNYVTELIASALYAKGLKSKFVRHYRGRLDFPDESKVQHYNARIILEVRESLSRCSRSLFIFDEVDNMPSGIFEALSSLVDYSNVIDGHDHTDAIFIFISNRGGAHISDHLGELLSGKGMLRTETTLRNFEEILKKAAYYLEGGMKKSSLIETYVIDHHLPFLPLEKEHVASCIAAEFKQRHVSPTTDHINVIFQRAVEYDPKFGVFAVAGCKNIAPAVSVYVQSKSLALLHPEL